MFLVMGSATIEGKNQDVSQYKLYNSCKLPCHIIVSYSLTSESMSFITCRLSSYFLYIVRSRSRSPVKAPHHDQMIPESKGYDNLIFSKGSCKPKIICGMMKNRHTSSSSSFSM